jgi:hypothetical protein
VYKGSPLFKPEKAPELPEVTLEALLHDRPKGMREFLSTFIEGHDTFEQTDLDFWTAVRDYRREVKSYAESADDRSDAVMFALEGAAEMVEQFVDLDSFDTIELDAASRDAVIRRVDELQTVMDGDDADGMDEDDLDAALQSLSAVFDNALAVASERLAARVWPEMRLSRELEEAARFLSGRALNLDDG